MWYSTLKGKGITTAVTAHRAVLKCEQGLAAAGEELYTLCRPLSNLQALQRLLLAHIP
jgi:hypothetical protein